MNTMPSSIVLVGAGKMGGAMLQGWLSLGLPGKAAVVVDPYPSDEIRDLATRTGVAINPAVVGTPEVLVLAIKPQTLDAAGSEITRMVGPGTLVISIMAGKTIGNILERVPTARAVVRAMPNTPAAVGRGITGAAANDAVSPSQRDTTAALLSTIGRFEWVAGEDLIDAVTAVSGSGPAYVFLLAECMAKAGVAAGLPPDLAERLARATVEGSGELMFRDASTDPAQLRRNVTSPGGTTAAALDVLMAEDGLEPLMTRAIAAAKQRARDLAG
jgi:pyrroline-5-carboxylate reductase